MKRIRCSITTDRHYKLSYKNSPKNKKNDYFTEINLEAQIDDESKSSINKSLKSITDVDFIPYVENEDNKMSYLILSHSEFKKLFFKSMRASYLSRSEEKVEIIPGFYCTVKNI